MESFGHMAPVYLPRSQLLNYTEMATEIKPAPAPFGAFQGGICPREQSQSQLQGWLCCGWKLERGEGALGKVIDA